MLTVCINLNHRGVIVINCIAKCRSQCAANSNIERKSQYHRTGVCSKFRGVIGRAVVNYQHLKIQSDHTIDNLGDGRCLIER